MAKTKYPREKRTSLVREPVSRAEKQRLLIEFLYLNITECGRCKGTNQHLDEILPLITPVLKASGFEIEIRKIHVQSEKQAAALGVVVSPTIRINGRDIQLKWKETPCSSCSKGCAGEVSCREWEHQGRWYTVPPKELIISAILREVYGRREEDVAVPPRKGRLPDNLKRFFAKKP